MIKRYDKESEEWIDKKITYKLKFNDSERSMQDLLSSLVENHAEEIDKSECCINNCEECKVIHKEKYKRKYCRECK